MNNMERLGRADSVLPWFGTVISVAFAAMIPLMCESPGGTTDTPEISNLSSLNPLYVAYTSPDPLEKPDTLTLSFNCNSAVRGPVEARYTLDSGTTWHVIGSVTTNNSRSGTITWVPGNADTAVINYFGKKSAYLQLMDTESDTRVTSDTFTLIGALPVLVEPPEKSAFSATDTIMVAYGQNVDISGFFTVLFKSDAMTDWVTVTTLTEQVRRDLPLRYYETKIVPEDYRDEVNEKEGDDFADPIQILVADYQQNTLVYLNYVSVSLQ